MTEYNSLRSHAQLRFLIRNDEALMEFYRRWADEMQVGDLAPEGLPARIAAVAERLVARRDELASLTFTDAASSPHGAGRPACAVAGPAAPTETLAGSLVTTTAAQPGIPS